MDPLHEPLPDRIMVETDVQAFAQRRRMQFTVIGVLLVAVLFMLLAAAVSFLEMGFAIAMSGAVLIGCSVLYFGQMRRERGLAAVDAPLVLDRAGFEIVNRGERLHFTWDQVENFVPQEQGGLWFNRWVDLVFTLTPQAQATVTTSPTVADRLLTWKAGEIAFRHPSPVPDFERLDELILAYWVQATGATLPDPIT